MSDWSSDVCSSDLPHFPSTSLTRVSHLCCGSAGTYALTHPDLARQLRDNKMNALESGKPEMIVTANIGCQTHLASAGRTSVRHWIEIVEQALEKE